MPTTLEEPTTTTKYSLLPSWGFVPAGSDQALKRIARAVIVQACYDAQKDDYTGSEAREWLLSEDCGIYCDFVGMNHNLVKTWVFAGCPDWRKPKQAKPGDDDDSRS